MTKSLRKLLANAAYGVPPISHRYLTEKETQEIIEYFQFLDVCGDCGKWHVIFPSIFYGVCTHDFFKKETTHVEKRRATDLACEHSIYWNELLSSLPRMKQTQQLITKAKMRLSKFGLKWAEMVLEKYPNTSDDTMWIIIMSKILQELKQKDLDLLMNLEEEE